MARRIRNLGHNEARHRRIVGEGKYLFEIAGESFHQNALNKICGGKNDDGHRHSCVAYLTPEPENPYDPRAIAVVIDNLKVGYVPRDATDQTLQAMKGNIASVDALIVGGWKRDDDEGSYGVKLDL